MAELDQVLFVRVDRALLERLDAALESEKKRRKGARCSRSDLVRVILSEHLEAALSVSPGAGT